MTKPMKYNRALDCIALAMQAYTRDKDEVLAARLFAKAMAQPDAQGAMDTIEASNRYAFAQLQASKAPAAKTEASTAATPKARVKASEEGAEMPGETPREEDDEMPVEADAFDGDPLDDVVEEEEAVEPVEPVVAGRRMAEVLSSMKKARDGK